MPDVIFHNGKPLFSGGDIAMDPRCCCLGPLVAHDCLVEGITYQVAKVARVIMTVAGGSGILRGTQATCTYPDGTPEPGSDPSNGPNHPSACKPQPIPAKTQEFHTLMNGSWELFDQVDCPLTTSRCSFGFIWLHCAYFGSSLPGSSTVIQTYLQRTDDVLFWEAGVDNSISGAGPFRGYSAYYRATATCPKIGGIYETRGIFTFSMYQLSLTNINRAEFEPPNSITTVIT